MLVQIIVTVKHITTCAKTRITTCPASFLYIILQRIGNIIMHYKTDIFLIDSHTKCRRGHDDVCLIVHKSILVGNFFIGFHFPIERECLVTVTSQFCSQFLCSFGA